MTQSPDPPYPNRDDDRVDGDAVSRRHLLASGATAGAVATAGCAGDSDSEANDDTQSQATEHPTVFVFNTGDGTVSLIDPASNEVVGSRAIGLSSSFPSNQYTPDLTDGSEDVLWLNVEHGVRAFTAGTLDEVAHVDTGSGANWQGQTPDGDHLVVSAQEPSHMNYRIDADRRSATVGEVVGIDHAAGEIIERIDVGSSPYGTAHNPFDIDDGGRPRTPRACGVDGGDNLLYRELFVRAHAGGRSVTTTVRGITISSQN